MREIVQAEQVETRECAVFSNRKLVYFFLARPAYRLKDGDQKSDQINRFPSVLVIDPGRLGAPFHVYPFDTGAGVSGRYGDKADPFVYLEDYELDPSLQAAARHINWAFGSNRAYFDGDLRQGLESKIDPWKAVLKGFVTIAGLASSRHNDPDKRASAIEIAFDHHVTLKGNSKLIIIPKQYMENGKNKNHEFLRRLRKLRIRWETYDWQPNLEPDFFFEEIHEIVRKNFQARRKL
ncbi:hypothetical protein KQX62_16405 [Rhodopseudomonas palustris]|uniref:Uncharacterized protein n=1 Tax=Rhodopseudomonas palustris TaxID=1076 RepID=A0AAX3DU07_RHOPL|nr:hypothetical protein [Rhodopseudomonas palustris]UYO38308.1 hypothetical protein KQX62_16405 [Rhodopseudomonas palustris]